MTARIALSHATGNRKYSPVYLHAVMTNPDEPTIADKMQRVLALSDTDSAWEHYQAYRDAGMEEQAEAWSVRAFIEKAQAEW